MRRQGACCCLFFTLILDTVVVSLTLRRTLQERKASNSQLSSLMGMIKRDGWSQFLLTIASSQTHRNHLLLACRRDLAQFRCLTTSTQRPDIDEPIQHHVVLGQ